ncbi:porin family protein [Hugenholtzia roseola]|uniref:type IX secretion/gliding motility protein PorT/SprT n=1 Tax=Hugenholtzia roseola TaxID=1002 RepID=UPI000687FC58|nr:porin family protein [Hugenholtzia roseola]
MHTSDFWNQLHLYGQKIKRTPSSKSNALWNLLLGCLFLSLVTIENTSAQKSNNLPYYDDKPLHYGFQIGLHQSWLKVRPSKTFMSNTDSITAITPLPSLGFSLGFIVDVPIDEEYWNFRINPNVAFYENQVRFRELRLERGDYVWHTENVESVFFELPLLFKHKSVRRGNMRMYLVGGAVLGAKIGGKKQKLDPERLATEDYNFELTYGAGFDIYMSFFKFSPEIRLTHGLADMKFNSPNSYSRSLDRVTTHRVTLYLNFE